MRCGQAAEPMIFITPYTTSTAALDLAPLPMDTFEARTRGISGRNRDLTIDQRLVRAEKFAWIGGIAAVTIIGIPIGIIYGAKSLHELYKARMLEIGQDS